MENKSNFGIRFKSDQTAIKIVTFKFHTCATATFFSRVIETFGSYSKNQRYKKKTVLIILFNVKSR